MTSTWRGSLPAQMPMEVKPGTNEEKKFKFIAANTRFWFSLRGREGFYAGVGAGIAFGFPPRRGL